MNAEQIRKLFQEIRRAHAGDARYAPHKPLLLLMALARIQRNQSRLFTFKEIEPDFKTLLTEFGPSNAPNTRNMPFWFLRNDAQGQLWELKLPDSLQTHPHGTAPNLTAMRQDGVTGGLSSEVERDLKAHPQLLVEVARNLLHSTFPETLHDDIANVIGLDLSDTGHRARDGEDYDQIGQRRQRSRAFRQQVLRAYEYRCCVCGFDLRLGHLPAGLEAAHIQWHTLGGPDLETNGLSLCALHHKLFDLGAFTIDPTSMKVVFSEHAMSGSRGMTGELRHHGQEFLRPADNDAMPARQFLDWNWNNVFKREARKLS
jgi:putative restriction endonuclease